MKLILYFQNGIALFRDSNAFVFNVFVNIQKQDIQYILYVHISQLERKKEIFKS